MNDTMMQAIQNAAASSAMEGMPLSADDIEIIRALLEGELELTDYLQMVASEHQEG